jgi:hypothetical protein
MPQKCKFEECPADLDVINQDISEDKQSRKKCMYTCMKHKESAYQILMMRLKYYNKHNNK